MNRKFDLPAASPSLEASMNFGQFGFANLVRSEMAVFTRIKAYRYALQKPNASRGGAKGFSAFLYGKEQCV
ncbi:MAG: hypothetical protein Q8S22_04515 [Eubacteriales bacterium]|jgi:hypothetical protein|nr:hypothetical protein [Eubacteriales bacterium]